MLFENKCLRRDLILREGALMQRTSLYAFLLLLYQCAFELGQVLEPFAIDIG